MLLLLFSVLATSRWCRYRGWFPQQPREAEGDEAKTAAETLSPEVKEEAVEIDELTAKLVGESRSSRWVRRFVDGAQRLCYKGWTWACALHLYYTAKKAFPIINRMLKQQREDFGDVLLLGIGHSAAHFVAQLFLQVWKQHFENQPETQSLWARTRIKPTEVYEVLFTINVYSNALVWLGFAWDIVFVRGGLPSSLGDDYLFWLVLVLVCTAIHLAFAIWSVHCTHGENDIGTPATEEDNNEPVQIIKHNVTLNELLSSTTPSLDGIRAADLAKLRSSELGMQPGDRERISTQTRTRGTI